MSVTLLEEKKKPLGYSLARFLGCSAFSRDGGQTTLWRSVIGQLFASLLSPARWNSLFSEIRRDERKEVNLKLCLLASIFFIAVNT